ncbi:MAG: sulfatase-like hydrolase/transferase [Acidobacteria bacterium]|nr:sulfatase-like hydrolase/transferase [Acidobacteriota bacterium]
MDRRSFLSSAGALPLAAGASPQTSSSAADRPPNILFLLFDKCRRDAFNCYGLRETHTPNIDRIASEGVRFDNCYVPQALCGPTRASILTGSYPHWHGLRRNVYPIKPSTLPSNYQEPIPDPWRDPRFKLIDNWAFFLNSGGYSTGHIGKWHLGPMNPGFFDYWKGFNSMLRHWLAEPHKSRYRPDVHTDQGLKFIEERAGSDEPWLLYQSYYTPHEPLDPPQRFADLYRGQEYPGYWGNVSALDWNVGRFLETLERTGQLDNTFIIVTTEHGRTWRDRPGTAEGMCIPYDEVARIPLILRYPKRLPQGKVWKSGVSSVDLMPTILDAAGINPLVGTVEVEARRPFLHGRNLFDVVNSGKDRWEAPCVMQNLPQAAIDGSFYEERAIRWERWKLVLRLFDNRPAYRPGELYDIDADPEENNNLYASKPDVVNDLAARLKAFGERTEDELAVRLGNWALKG